MFQVIPQIYLNYKRKSTVGWSIVGIWLDFCGGVLSVVQMLLYCVIDSDNTQLTGNIPKLLLSIESLIIDVIFVFQHYIFYPSPISASHNNGNNDKDEESKDLLNAANSIQ
jgi:cystinosin